MIIQNQIMVQQIKLLDTEILKSNLCDYNDAYILVTGDINVVAAPATQVAFKIVQHLLNMSQKLMKEQ